MFVVCTDSTHTYTRTYKILKYSYVLIEYYVLLYYEYKVLFSPYPNNFRNQSSGTLIVNVLS